MKINMQTLKENEDGSADIAMEVDEEAKRWIMALGIEAVLMKAIKQAQCTPIEPEFSAYHKAVTAAQEFIDGSPPAELGIYTIRKAFEMGFLRGHDDATNSR